MRHVGGGHQLIGNEDGRIQVVFNGEIYNHHALREQLHARGHVFRHLASGRLARRTWPALDEAPAAGGAVRPWPA